MKRKAAAFLFFCPFCKLRFAKIVTFLKIIPKKFEPKPRFLIFVCLKNRFNKFINSINIINLIY